MSNTKEHSRQIKFPMKFMVRPLALFHFCVPGWPWPLFKCGVNALRLWDHSTSCIRRIPFIEFMTIRPEDSVALFIVIRNFTARPLTAFQRVTVNLIDRFDGENDTFAEIEKYFDLKSFAAG